jgi:trimethylamine--corrinoid protein Co-methyltransferase
MKPDDAEKIHEASLKILEDVGIRLEHDEIVERVLKLGARPGAGSQDVRFPREMVLEFLDLVPSEVRLDSRGGGSTTLTAISPSIFWTNPGLQILDDGIVRDVTADDLGRIARLCDGLSNVQGIMGMAMKDVLPRHRDFVGVRVIAENSRKHVRALCFTPQGMEALAEMKQIFPGNWLSIGFTAHGPLRWTKLALDIFLKSSGSGIPTTVNGEPMAGATGPVSLAGSAAVGSAEILSGIVVNQVLEPGRPVIYNLGLAHIFDMKYATAVTGGPENALFAKASAEMGRYYQIPSSSWVSTESVFDDSQAALEKMFGYATHIANGTNLIWGMGQLESEKTISPIQLVIDNETIDYVSRYQRGFEVNQETLQLDLIREVGMGGSFLETDHTLMNYRDHLWLPSILNRQPRESCRGSLEEVARSEARRILQENDGEKLGAAELAELKRIEEVYREKIR